MKKKDDGVLLGVCLEISSIKKACNLRADKSDGNPSIKEGFWKASGLEKRN